jgi:hypothetical protein
VLENPVGDIAPAIVGSKSRATVLWQSATELRAQSFSWPPGTPEGAPHTIAAVDPSATHLVAGTPFRDLVAGAAFAGTFPDQGRYVVLVIDPWSGALASGPHEIWAGTVDNPVMGLGAAEAEGILGLCYTRDRPADLVFALLGPDGRPGAGEVILARDNAAIHHCAVAYGAGMWAVAWVTYTEPPRLDVQLFRAGE